MTATTATRSKFSVTDSEATGIKERWDSLQGQGYQLDYDRAKFLHTIWEGRLNRDDKLLGAFLVAIIGEYPGKRCARLIRLAKAYDQNRNVDTWRMIGAGPVTMLVRLAPREQRKILTKIRQTLRSTGRSVVHVGTFRLIARAILGQAQYNKALVERNTGGSALRRQVDKLQKEVGSLKTELVAYKADLLALIRQDPTVVRRLSKPVRSGLGIDLATGRK